jgi:hypothetical protein
MLDDIIRNIMPLDSDFVLTLNSHHGVYFVNLFHKNGKAVNIEGNDLEATLKRAYTQLCAKVNNNTCREPLDCSCGMC